MSLDQFYTKPEVAAKCFMTLADRECDLWLEPCAGMGSFYSLFPEDKRLGYDLEPRYDGVIEQDFLKVVLPKDTNIIVATNPPFGYRAQGAIEFFNKAAEAANIIGMIVPRSFRKAYIINQLNTYYHLTHEDILALGIFDGGADKIRTVWQVWERREVKRDKIVLPSTHPDFTIVPQGKGFDRNKADIAIRRTGYKSVGEVIDPEDANPITQFIFISIENEDAIDIFESMDLSCAFDTALAPTVTQGEIIRAYITSKEK